MEYIKFMEGGNTVISVLTLIFAMMSIAAILIRQLTFDHTRDIQSTFTEILPISSIIITVVATIYIISTFSPINL